jgi:DNA-directed RNA polymerase specialized sigma24 family protein
MSHEESSAPAVSPPDDIYNRIFSELPPLGSPEYIRLLEMAPVSELPAQVLVRAFRQLIASGSDAAADATLVRLVASKKFNYLAAIRRLAYHEVAKGQGRYDEEDLIQEAISEIIKTLPTARGEMAEKAWVMFSKQRFQDGWRNLNGRRGEKLREKPFEAVKDEETGDYPDPAEETDGQEAEWHVQLKSSKLPWLENFIRKTTAQITDPVIRQVAEDQFGDDPSPISAGKSEGGKPPLTEQLDLSRFQVSRALKSAKARLIAALRTRGENEIDAEWLRRFLKD